MGSETTETHSKTQGRYSEPTLIKKMEDYGVGRPSTYASTMSTIQDRGYVKKKTTDHSFGILQKMS